MFVLPFFQWLIPREQSYDCCRQSEEEDEEDEGEQQLVYHTIRHPFEDHAGVFCVCVCSSHFYSQVLLLYVNRSLFSSIDIYC